MNNETVGFKNNTLDSVPKNYQKKFFIIIIVLLCLLFFCVLVLAFYFYNQNLKLRQSQTMFVPSPTNTPTVVLSTPTPQTQFGNIIWYSQPQKIPFISLFKQNDCPTCFSVSEKNGTEFYQVADFSDGSKLIDGLIQFDAPGFNLVRFIESKNKYFYIDTGLNPFIRQTLSEQLLTSVGAINLNIPGLEIPENIIDKNFNFSKLYETTNFFSKLENPVKILESPFGPLYENIVPVTDVSGIFAKKFFLKLKDNILVEYQMPLDILKSKTNYNQNLVSSCSLGGVGSPFIKDGSGLLLGKKETGELFNNQPLYQISDPNNLFVKEIYNKVYKIGRDYPGAPSIISLNDFADKRTHFLWQDSQGDWRIFLNNDFSSMAECGKPVIYLYPKEETNINVQVGAKISKSEPLYPQKGWTVLAKPNGELIYQGKVYKNLFWEGLGKGNYPNHKKYGVVVEQKNLIFVLKNQLKQLGLNGQESSDFMDFWQSKLPKTSYVRLTWLNTKDMDELAPISVFPKPDTKIRIFLEFEGLDKPKELTPQKLSSIPRNGFTLIEWGGLLIK